MTKKNEKEQAAPNADGDELVESFGESATNRRRILRVLGVAGAVSVLGPGVASARKGRGRGRGRGCGRGRCRGRGK